MKVSRKQAQNKLPNVVLVIVNSWSRLNNCLNAGCRCAYLSTIHDAEMDICLVGGRYQ